MADLRTRREKLEAMADQSVSPNEAAIARRLLSELDAESPPRPRAAIEAEADDFLSRMSFEYTPDGVKVHYDGGIRPGVLGAMLREALAAEKRTRIG